LEAEIHVNIGLRREFRAQPKTSFSVALMYKKYLLHNLLKLDVRCTEKEGFVTRVELGEVFKMTAINIYALLN
jgi:hypothetical protein